MGYHPPNTSDDSISASDPITSPGGVATDSAPATPFPAETRTKPWLTWIIAAICVGIFVGVNLSGDASSWEGMRRWGAPPAQTIWHGAYWGLVTSVFVHVAIWHLAFNLYWLWILGRILETTIGSTRWLAFFAASAIVSSAAQLAVSGATGIGLSGVIYAVFGFMWVGRRAYPGFARVLPPQTVRLFLGWLVLCIVLTALDVWKVGNAAHIGGLLFGLGVGWAFVVVPRATWPKLALGALSLAATVLALTWCPWNFEWVAARAYAAHARGDYAAAVEGYLRCERFHEQTVWVTQNLALAYIAMGDDDRYGAAMKKLRSMDPEAAREVERNLAGLPSTTTPRPE